LNGLDEAAVVRLCQTGDQEAFRVLVDRHRTVLFGTAYLMTRDRDLAEDAVQQALVQMWRHLPGLRLRGSLKSWLVRIVVNEVNQQRRQKHIPAVPLDQMPDVADGSDDVLAALVGDERRRGLRRALGMLPPEQREAVVLRYYSELTVPEIAAAMGCREGTVKSRLSRGLESLRKMLGGDENWGEGR
jgi:RNA polymerase sigma-70 factor (ECF subfamily)